jgi:4-amino-4-deoxy-L-arabinose transferase-like glycosyltransferase
MTKKTAAIILIFISGIIIRFYSLGSIPNGLTTDEADNGYNAHSILKTQKDVYGRHFPLYFQSFNDYKPGLSIYLQIPFVYLFGLTDISVRILPALLGSLIPLLIFWLIRLMYPRNHLLPFIAMVQSAVAPWQIAISRIEPGFTVALFLYLLVFISFYLAINKNIKYLLVSAALMAVSFYAYYASIIYAPLIALILFGIYHRVLIKNVKTVIFAAIIFLTVSSAALLNFAGGQGRSRLNSINIFTPDISLPTSIQEMQYDIAGNNPFAGLIHNRRIVYLNSFLDNYFDFFNLDYLFVNSVRIRYFYTNYTGLLYLLEIFFVFSGLLIMIKRRLKNDFFLLGLLIIGPIPGAIVQGAAYPHRALLFLLALQIVSAIGVTVFYRQIKNKIFGKALVILVFGFYLLCASFFLHQYFVHSRYEFSNESNNGAWLSSEVKKAIPFVGKYQNSYKNIVFSWYVPKLAPAVYFMFYQSLDPRPFQQKAALWTKDPPHFRQIYSQVGKIEFRSINWEKDKNLKNTLLVGYPAEFPRNVKNVIDRTFEDNGQTHFMFVAP